MPLLLFVPLISLQAAQFPATKAPLPLLVAKDLPRATRGPMPPPGPDPGAEASPWGQARRGARRGPSIPALQLPGGSFRVQDKVPDVSGWRAYAIEVPAGGTLKAQVVEGRKAWFRVRAMNAWGRDEPGLLQNRIPTGEPLATYRNLGSEAKTLYLVVDTLDANMVGEPYTLEVTRGGEAG